MKKIAFVIPYFGKLPNYFPFWLKSAELNPTIDFFIFTNDQFQGELPSNVFLKLWNYSFFLEFVASKFDFNLALTNPYKLCDFKPAYGFIFSEYLKDYDFWGHCDIDLILGDIRKFITDELLNNFEKIQSLGHFELYKNTKCINEHFKTKIPEFISYKEIFSSPAIWAFDESTSPINKALWRNTKQFCNNSFFDDINHRFKNFKRNKKFNNTIYYRDNDRLIRVENNSEKELMYVHFQYRRVNCLSTPGNSIILSPFGLQFTTLTQAESQIKFGKKKVICNRIFATIKKPLLRRLYQIYFFIFGKYPNAPFVMPSFFSKEKNWIKYRLNKK